MLYINFKIIQRYSQEKPFKAATKMWKYIIFKDTPEKILLKILNINIGVNFFPLATFFCVKKTKKNKNNNTIEPINVTSICNKLFNFT
jgi:branched-subunit amino acid transport protein AzlD